MWNNFRALVFIGSLVVFAIGCKSKKPLAERMSNLDDLQKSEIIEMLDNPNFSITSLQMKATGSASLAGTNQSFRLEIRMVPDSIIWMDLSDPTFGLKIARAQLTPDSIAYYSRLLKRADSGSFDKLVDLIGAPVNFEMFQNALLGLPAVMPTKEISTGLQNQSYYLKGKYEATQASLVTNALVTLFLDPSTQRLSRQTLLTGSEQLQGTYTNYENVEGQQLPFRIQLQFSKGVSNSSLTLDVKEYSINNTLQFPFNLPRNYEPF